MQNVSTIYSKHFAKVSKAQAAAAEAESARELETTKAAKKALAESGLSLRKAAKKCHLSAPYLSDILRGNRRWSGQALNLFSAAFPATETASRRTKRK